VRVCLIDTGPLVAYLDRADPMHEAVVQKLDVFSKPLVTTSAVITEAMHMLSDARDGPLVLAEFVETTDLRIFESTRTGQIRQAALLMRKYSDTPMDFADATLVLLADTLGVTEILTLDRRGFATYRTVKGKRFTLVLQS
jgi:predicted nucleic acid-binding protein